jgi:hypothetical protein
MKGTNMVEIEPATALLGVLEELQAIPPNDWTEGDLAELALRLDRVTAVREHLYEVQGWLELSLAERMDTDEVTVPHVGRLRRTRGFRGTWRDSDASARMREDVAHAVARAVAVDVGTGDIDPVKRNVALHAIQTAYEAIPAFSSLKVAGQKRLGLDLLDYRNFDAYYTVKLEVGE